MANVRKLFTDHCNKITLQKRCFDNELSLLPHVQEFKKQKTLPDLFSTVPSQLLRGFALRTTPSKIVLIVENFLNICFTDPSLSQEAAVTYFREQVSSSPLSTPHIFVIPEGEHSSLGACPVRLMISTSPMIN